MCITMVAPVDHWSDLWITVEVRTVWVVPWMHVGIAQIAGNSVMFRYITLCFQSEKRTGKHHLVLSLSTD